jgi:hypothetical protein
MQEAKDVARPFCDAGNQGERRCNSDADTQWLHDGQLASLERAPLGTGFRRIQVRMFAAKRCYIIENFDEVRPGKSRSTPDIVKFPVQRIILVHSGECVELAASDALPGVRRAEVLPYLHRSAQCSRLIGRGR